MLTEHGANGVDSAEATKPIDVGKQVDYLAQLMKDTAEAGQRGRWFIENCVEHIIATVMTNIPEEERSIVNKIQEARRTRVRTIQEWGY